MCTYIYIYVHYRHKYTSVGYFFNAPSACIIHLLLEIYTNITAASWTWYVVYQFSFYFHESFIVLKVPRTFSRTKNTAKIMKLSPKHIHMYDLYMWKLSDTYAYQYFILMITKGLCHIFMQKYLKAFRSRFFKKFQQLALDKFFYI